MSSRNTADEFTQAMTILGRTAEEIGELYGSHPRALLSDNALTDALIEALCKVVEERVVRTRSEIVRTLVEEVDAFARGAVGAADAHRIFCAPASEWQSTFRTCCARDAAWALLSRDGATEGLPARGHALPPDATLAVDASDGALRGFTVEIPLPAEAVERSPTLSFQLLLPARRIWHPAAPRLTVKGGLTAFGAEKGDWLFDGAAVQLRWWSSAADERLLALVRSGENQRTGLDTLRCNHVHVRVDARAARARLLARGDADPRLHLRFELPEAIGAADVYGDFVVVEVPDGAPESVQQMIGAPSRHMRARRAQPGKWLIQHGSRRDECGLDALAVEYGTADAEEGDGADPFAVRRERLRAALQPHRILGTLEDLADYVDALLDGQGAVDRQGVSGAPGAIWRADRPDAAWSGLDTYAYVWRVPIIKSADAHPLRFEHRLQAAVLATNGRAPLGVRIVLEPRDHR